MKNLLLLFTLLNFPVISFSQDTTEISPVEVLVEEMPEYPGGTNSLIQFVNDNIKYPEEAIDKNIQGRVYVSFVIDTTGAVQDAKMLRGIPGLNEEALRIVNMMPRWKPGTQNGKKVNVQYTLPISFKLYDKKKKRNR